MNRALIAGLFGLLSLTATPAMAAPTVSLTAPVNAAQFLAPATFGLSASVTASTGTTITKVEFYRGTTLIGSDTSSPYAVIWSNAPSGSYSLTAKATDNVGGVTTSTARTVTVNAANTPPTVSLSAPANTAKYFAPASLTVSASANGVETNTPVSKVEFYANGTLIGSDTTSPYSISWANPAAGTYSLTAIATDSAGGITTSAARSITINATNTPPTVSLSAPANNAKYLAPATVTVTASASGVETNTPISKVEFLDGTTVIATLTATPYTYAWANPAVGVHSLTARATDSGGAITPSAARSITITAANTPPTVSLSAPANNATVQAPVDVLVSASAWAPEINDTVAKVEFYQGTTLIGTATASPWQVTWVKPAAGVYNLTAKATDGQGGTTTSALRKLTVTASPTAKLYFLHTDQINTPRLVTDENNTVVWRNNPLIEPFGMNPPEEDPDADGTPFTMNLRFPGQYADKETNTNYNYYRDYDPSTGRYLESDPIGLEAGLNTYTYVGGNPLSVKDPLGLWGIATAFGGGGAPGGGKGGSGGEAWTGAYYSPDACPGSRVGTYTSTAQDWGFGYGLGVQFSLFFGDGTNSFSGTGQAFTGTIGDLSFGLLFADGKVAGLTFGASVGLPIGGIASAPSRTLLH